MEIRDIEGAIEGILFAAGEPVPIERIADALETDASLISDTADALRDRYAFDRRGIRVVRLDGALQMCSSPEYEGCIRAALERGRQSKLTQPSLETLSVVAYFQPVTKSYIEQVRGVDSAYSVGLLQSRGLIEPCGRLPVPGRPVLYRTTRDFLRTFGIENLGELPFLPQTDARDGQLTFDAVESGDAP
jgi:segregation and condensation protein B